MTIRRILIVAGSDSGGGAGIQADIKTVVMLGGHAMTAVTALTAQNTLGVVGVMPVPATFVVEQMDAVISDIGVDAVKIGMIGSPGTAHAVADRLEGLGVPIVFDPVMVATSGSALADEATVAAFGRLMDIATLVTPNAPELEALAGAGPREAAALRLAERYRVAILAKGGEVPGNEVTDLLVGPNLQVRRWSDARLDTPHTHGTGCTLASAVAAGLAEGMTLEAAVERARAFVRFALREAPGFGAGAGPMGHGSVRLDLPSADGPTLNQVTLPASDYEASVAFYRALGCHRIVASPPRYARFVVPGGLTLSIEVHDPPVAPSTSEYFFQCSDVDAEAARLQRAGIAVQAPPEDRFYGWRVAELRDPHGNRICLYSPGENRRFPPWRLDIHRKD